MSHLFAIDPWKLTESCVDIAKMTLAETLFSLANGYIGTRGTFEESLADNASSQEGTYLNGVYAREAIYYDEIAYGYATHNNKLLQAPDGKSLRICVNGEPLNTSSSHVVSHHRELDFRTATTRRTTRWNLEGGRQIDVKATRVVSLKHQHVMALEIVITPIGFDGTIDVASLFGIAHLTDKEKSTHDPRAGHISVADTLTEINSHAQEHTLSYVHEVEGSGFHVASVCTHRCSHGQGKAVQPADGGSLRYEMSAALKDGESMTITKYLAYQHKQASDHDDILARATDAVGEAASEGFEALVTQQTSVLDEFWQDANITIEGHDALQQGIRYNMLQIFLSSGRDGTSSIAAKGLSGPGYDGHYFWDTEMYTVPFFTYSAPEMARSLLSYRYATLDAARKRAREMNHPAGALFAWRTIGGEECSSFFPAGTAQYHINSDIAYATIQYVYATHDWEFLEQQGLELLMETARIWADMCHFSARHGNKFCIFEVTGPDEYSAMVDNNFYTNAMAQFHLAKTVDLYEELKTRQPSALHRMCERIHVADDELALWKRISDNMYLPYDETLGIHAQDENFLTKPVWDFENTPKDTYPLLLHYHPLVIYRHQVLKQADVVQAMALLGHAFDRTTRTRNIEYYEPLTTHDSTLSTCIYSIECARAGKHEQAYALFENNVRMDIDNLHHNTEYGLHTACMAGSWMCIIMGFVGMEMYDETLHFSPHLPQQWTRFACSIRFRSARVAIEVTAAGVSYTLTGAPHLTISHHGNNVMLTEHKTCRVSYENMKERTYA